MTNVFPTLAAASRRLGRTAVYQVALLAYAQADPAVPLWVKAQSVGVLAYVVSPVDAIPDAVPVAGFTDDLGLVGRVVWCVNLHASDATRARATAFADRLFGPDGAAAPDAPNSGPDPVPA